MTHYQPLTRPMRIALLALAFLALGLAITEAQATDVASSTPDFAAIDAHIEEQMRELRIPGLAIAIVQGDTIVHLKGFGVTRSNGQPITPQTPFQLASIVKPMTGVAVMQLVEAGKLDLDTPVQHYLPWFRVANQEASAQITARHLLYHTSGLPGTLGLEHALSGDERPNALELRVRELRSAQVQRPAGQTYEYSNAGYMVLGMLIQEVSGQPYEAYMQTHVYGPLQMRHMFTDWDEAQAQGAASGHHFWFGMPQPSQLAVDRAILPAGASTAGSAEDVAHFLIAQLNGGRYGNTTVLSAEGIGAMQQPALPGPRADESYGMDWSIGPVGGETAIYKGGSLVNFATQMVVFPERRLGMVVLINANRGFDNQLGDIRLPMLSYNLAELLVGQEPTSIGKSPTPTMFYAAVIAAVALQVAGMARTIALVRRWRRVSERHPQTRTALLMRIGLPLVVNIGWGLLIFVGMPSIAGLPFLLIRYLAPDIGTTLLISGTVALGWGIVRTALVWWVIRAAQPKTSFVVGGPIKA